MKNTIAGTIAVIRQFSEIERVDTVVSLIQKQLATCGAQKDRDAIRSALEHALREGSRAVLFCCYSDQSTLIAFSFANVCSGLESGADYLWINELFVDEAFRNNNVAGTLLEFIESWARRNGVRHIALITGRENGAAGRLYEKKGYSIDSARWIDKVLE